MITAATRHVLVVKHVLILFVKVCILLTKTAALNAFDCIVKFVFIYIASYSTANLKTTM